MSSTEYDRWGHVTRSDDGELWHDAAVPGHIREAATVGEFLDDPRPGIILADCSCGAEYEVPQGDDEYGALEKAHREHVAAVAAILPPGCDLPGCQHHYAPGRNLAAEGCICPCWFDGGGWHLIERNPSCAAHSPDGKEN